MSKLVYDVGIHEKGKYTSKIDGKITKEYSLWNAMLQRCYSTNCQLKQTTYIGCSVSEDFKNFQFFAEWCQDKTGFNLKDWQLDKDILCKGNKQYNQERCVFVPREINNCILQHGAGRGSYPVGVSYCKRRGVYRVQVRIKGKQSYFGSFDTPEQAFSTYKEYKESQVKALALEYKDQIDPRVYKALLDWSVGIND